MEEGSQISRLADLVESAVFAFNEFVPSQINIALAEHLELLQALLVDLRKLSEGLPGEIVTTTELEAIFARHGTNITLVDMQTKQLASELRSAEFFVAPASRDA